MTHPNENKATVDAAITSRRSIRAFLPTAAERAMVEEILEVASRAPSGTNTQPWRVYVLTGEAKATLSQKIVQAYDDPAQCAEHTEEYAPLGDFARFVDRSPVAPPPPVGSPATSNQSTGTRP